jgi:hypothetical protein
MHDVVRQEEMQWINCRGGNALRLGVATQMTFLRDHFPCILFDTKLKFVLGLSLATVIGSDVCYFLICFNALGDKPSQVELSVAAQRSNK